MIYLVSCLKKLIMAWDARGLWDFFFFEAHCYNISQWGPGGEKNCQPTSKYFKYFSDIRSSIFFAQTINITGFKNCQKNDDFWWLKIPTGGHIPTEVAAVPLRATGDQWAPVESFDGW